MIEEFNREETEIRDDETIEFAEEALMSEEDDTEELSLDDYLLIWKKQYGNIFKTVIEDDVYVWRKLKRSEYKDITKMVSEAYEDDTQAQNWLRQEEITKTVLLYPFDAEEAIEEAAGISVVISQDCLVRSGFGAISTQA